MEKKSHIIINIIDTEPEVPKSIKKGEIWYAKDINNIFYASAYGSRVGWGMPAELKDILENGNLVDDPSSDKQSPKTIDDKFILDLIATTLSPVSYFEKKK